MSRVSQSHYVLYVLALKLHFHLYDGVEGQTNAKHGRQDVHLGLHAQEVAVPKGHRTSGGVEHPVGSEGCFLLVAEQNSE